MRPRSIGARRFSSPCRIMTGSSAASAIRRTVPRSGGTSRASAAVSASGPTPSAISSTRARVSRASSAGFRLLVHEAIGDEHDDTPLRRRWFELRDGSFQRRSEASASLRLCRPGPRHRLAERPRSLQREQRARLGVECDECRRVAIGQHRGGLDHRLSAQGESGPRRRTSRPCFPTCPRRTRARSRRPGRKVATAPGAGIQASNHCMNPPRTTAAPPSTSNPVPASRTARSSAAQVARGVPPMPAHRRARPQHIDRGCPPSRRDRMAKRCRASTRHHAGCGPGRMARL